MGSLRPRALGWVIVAGCGFQPGAVGRLPMDAIDAPDAEPIDAMVVPAVAYAIDFTTLYTIDFANQSITLVGPLHTTTIAVLPNLDSIAVVEGALVAVTNNSTGQSLATIDPATALVTFAATPLATVREYYGLTYDPTTSTVLAGTGDTGALYRADLGPDTMTQLGSFGGGLTIYGDIAWLDGVVYGTMIGGPCSPTCIATIDPTLGTASILSTDAPSALPALSGFQHKLYAISGVGVVYGIDLASGEATMLFDTGKQMVDTAP